MSGLLPVDGLQDVVVHCDRALEFRGCIICDLLSYVMNKGKRSQVWITHHVHPNIVAVASLKEFAAVIAVGGGELDEETIDKARVEGVNLLTTALQAYDVAIKIAKLQG